jgi:hypothetical protein
MKQAARDAAFTYLSAVSRDDKRFVRIADSTMKNAEVTRDGKWAVGSDNRPYMSDWKESQVRLLPGKHRSTGERTLIVKGISLRWDYRPTAGTFCSGKMGHIHVQSCCRNHD